MICKFQLHFGLWRYRTVQKEFLIVFFAALFHLYSQLFSTEAGWHIETDVLHVDNRQACLEAKDEMQKRGRGSKSLNICLGSPFFFIYWNINGFCLRPNVFVCSFSVCWLKFWVMLSYWFTSLWAFLSNYRSQAGCVHHLLPLRTPISRVLPLMSRFALGSFFTWKISVKFSFAKLTTSKYSCVNDCFLVWQRLVKHFCHFYATVKGAIGDFLSLVLVQITWKTPQHTFMATPPTS